MTIRVEIHEVKASQLFSITGLAEKNASAIGQKLRLPRDECTIEAHVQPEEKTLSLVEAGQLKETFEVLCRVTWHDIPMKPLDDEKIMGWIKG